MKKQKNAQAKIIEWSVGDAPLHFSPVCAAIGNFDGVHKGHRQLVGAAVEAANSLGRESAVITFDPHPREFFRQENAPFHLVDRLEKDWLLSYPEMN